MTAGAWAGKLELNVCAGARKAVQPGCGCGTQGHPEHGEQQRGGRHGCIQSHGADGGWVLIWKLHRMGIME